MNPTPRPISTQAREITPSCWALAAVLALGTLGSAHAQTLVVSADLPISFIGDPNYHAVQLNTRQGDVLKVNYDTDFNAGYGATSWESVTWVSSTGSRVSAAMAGVDIYFQPVQDRHLIINNLTVRNVDLDMGTVQLHFQSPTASPNAPIALTLDNGSLGGGLRTPLLWSPSPFQFNVTGVSQIDGWQGRLASVTTLDVASGATLRIKDCGSVTSPTLTDKLYFDGFNNTATIHGGSLIVDNSAFVFGRDPHSIDANQSTMTFTDNALLQITGPNTTPKLETDRIILQNSTLNMANNTDLKARTFVELDNSTAVIGDGGRAEALQVIVKGNSTATLAHHTGGGQGIVTSFLDVNNGATLPLAGAGDMAVSGGQVRFPSTGHGAIRVTENAALVLKNATLILGSRGSLTTERTATTESSVGLENSSMSLHSAGTFVNNGSFTVDKGTEFNVIGHATIGGTGLTDMDGRMNFGTGLPGEQAKSSLTTGNEQDIGMNALLTMTLDPLGLTSDKIICEGLLSIAPTAELDLQVVNDTALALGTKFALVDYRGLQTPLGDYNHFNGYDQGTVFTLGDNIYQINYRDGDYLVGSASFITLTTVPEPTAAALFLSGALLLGLARRKAR